MSERLLSHYFQSAHFIAFTFAQQNPASLLDKHQPNMSTLKLGSLLIRTLAKPVATSIKTQAKQHPAFREFCIGVAQQSHKLEMTLKMKFLGYKKEVIRPLNDARAVEAGANFLSESFVFGVAASIIIAEQWRSHYTAKERRNYVDDALENLESDRADMKEEVKTMRDNMNLLEERVQLMQDENDRLRKVLDEVLSVSLGLKPHSQYEQPTVVRLPGVSTEN
ncbi:optic atrophy 3 protein-domain-containing protein [Syncephalastrum racemosum]|uniref:Optic atrophy 3 protein-domain-containing protein n=1 Tax=Syncephalastrum racemosum TaxID=13706 RepID=A0A1X2HNT3_SYNRA|nr:optic atrophy 3 protein-domain-containing protein [Syncephalastrum racemosum]